MVALPVLRREDVAKHCTPDDAWVIVDNKVYNMSKFQRLHPGGQAVLQPFFGKDATEDFKVYHNERWVLAKYGDKLCVGTVDPSESEFKRMAKHAQEIEAGAFGDLVPYGDPVWYQRFVKHSPYYRDSHRKWRARCRVFVDKEVIPRTEELSKMKRPPEDLMLKLGAEGMLAACVGSPLPLNYLPADVQRKLPEDWDYFHEMIFYDEICRCGVAAIVAGVTNGCAIGLPALLRFGRKELCDRVAPDVLAGRKFIALAISEPNAGSDVAGLICSAERSEDGEYFTVNGNKKWITNGTYADYFVTAVRTGGPGMLSFLLVERGTEGFDTRKLSIRDSDLSGTAYLDFLNAMIPVGNLIGEENMGFKLVMYNFNHERFYISVCMARMARVCLEESLKYALHRKAFGKRLADIQSVRMKIAAMLREVEGYQAWLESVVYQLCNLSHDDAQNLGDVLCLIKAQGSKVYEYCARETTMIFGGNALYLDGVGRKIEPAVSQVKGYQIPAGAEDVMDDFGGKMAFKRAIQLAKL